MAESTPRDAIALLKDHHRKVAELFEQFEKARGDGHKEKLAQQIAWSCRSTPRSRKRFSTRPAKAKWTRICSRKATSSTTRRK